VKTIDRIVLQEPGGARELSLEEFRLIKLNARVKLLLEQRVQFWQGSRAIPTSEALKLLAAGG